MTFDRRVADAIELIEFLRRYLGVDKVVVLAESMGTLTGLPLAMRRPDLVQALVATDLYVNMAANEAAKWQLTLERLRSADNAKGVAALDGIGPDAGHFAAFTQPDRFLAELRTRVRPLGAAPGPASIREP
jgi:alpha/beta hydrolase fold